MEVCHTWLERLNQTARARRMEGSCVRPIGFLSLHSGSARRSLLLLIFWLVELFCLAVRRKDPYLPFPFAEAVAGVDGLDVAAPAIGFWVFVDFDSLQGVGPHDARTGDFRKLFAEVFAESLLVFPTHWSDAKAILCRDSAAHEFDAYPRAAE